MIGISAGAIQLGQCWLADRGQALEELIETFKLIPFVINVHDEEQWRELKRAIGLLNGRVKGIGIPTGGGLIYYPDQSIEAIRHPLYEFTIEEGEIKDALFYFQVKEEEE